MKGKEIMEVEFDKAVSVIKIAKGYRYLKKKERKIANICFLLMCAGTVISIIDYYFRKQDMSIFYAFFFIIFGIIVVIYMYSKKSIRDIEKMISSAISFYQKNSLDRINFCDVPRAGGAEAAFTFQGGAC